MTALQIALTSGGLIGLGLSLLIWRLVPAQPDLASALGNLAPERSLTRSGDNPVTSGAKDRVGLWVMRTLPLTSWATPPTKELAILRIPTHRYYGEKALYGVVGLFFPSVAAALAAVIGLQVGFVIPLVASLMLAIALSFLPDYNVRSDAAAARTDFRRALGAYVDLVALERNAGSGARQAMEKAAQVGDSWVFRRLAEELARSRYSGVPPWDSLTSLAEELGLSELAEVSDIMRMSGEEGAAVYATLRARAASMRAAMMSAELAKANSTSERMTLPGSALALIFLVFLAAPALLRVLSSGA